MSVKKAAFFAGIIFSLLFYSCGEMDSLFSSSRTYQVSAKGELHSLDEYALIKRNEKIEPFFTQPIRDDPDIIGLTVTITTPDGIQAGRQIRYVLDSVNETDDQDSDYSDDLAVIIPMKRMDRTFPSFSMPLDLKPGPYVMVFQVNGRKNSQISKTEKTVFYLGREDYTITGISVYLPESAAPSHLIPPETMVLLNAAVTASSALDPYIAWYNGKVCIGEGKVSEGANQMLWKLPSHTGFQNIRAEVIPFPPVSNNGKGNLIVAQSGTALLGKSMEISLAVSSAGQLAAVHANIPDSLKTKYEGIVLRDYQFAGNLVDSENPFAANNLKILSVAENGDKALPRWFPAKDVYGLGVGPGNMYEIPSFSLDSSKDLLFQLRFMPQNKGTLFSVAFDKPGTELDFSLDEQGFLLKTFTNGMEEQIPLGISAKDSLYTLLLTFSFQHNDLTFTLVEDGELFSKAEKIIKLSGLQTIEGVFRLGGSRLDNNQAEVGSNQAGLDSNLDGARAEADGLPDVGHVQGDSRFPVMIINGLSMFSLVPVAGNEAINE